MQQTIKLAIYLTIKPLCLIFKGLPFLQGKSTFQRCLCRPPTWTTSMLKKLKLTNYYNKMKPSFRPKLSSFLPSLCKLKSFCQTLFKNNVIFQLVDHKELATICSYPYTWCGEHLWLWCFSYGTNLIAPYNPQEAMLELPKYGNSMVSYDLVTFHSARSLSVFISYFGFENLFLTMKNHFYIICWFWFASGRYSSMLMITNVDETIW